MSARPEARDYPFLKFISVMSWKNALIPIITVLGLQMGALLTGTVIVETIFDRPGNWQFALPIHL